MRAKRLGAALAAGVAAVTLGAPGALAQTEADAPRLVIRQVDATDPANVNVTFFYTGQPGDLNGLTLREDDSILPTSAAKPLAEVTDQAMGVALLVDTSASMDTDGTLGRAKAAAHAFVDASAPTDRIAIVGFNQQAQVVQGLTDNRLLLAAAIDGLSASGDTAIWNGIARGAALFASQSNLQANVVVVTDGAEDIGGASFEAAQRAVDESGAALFGVALSRRGFDTAPLQQLAEDSGGQLLTTTDNSQLPALFGQVGSSLRGQYQVTYASNATEQGVSNLTVTVGPSHSEASFVSGSAASGATNTRPVDAAKARGPSFLHGTTAKYAGIALALLAAILATYAIVLVFVRDPSGLSAVLRPYSEGYVAADDETEGDGSMAQTALIQRAVQFTGQLAERQGFLTRVESALERANLPLRAAEALFFYIAAVVVLGTLATLLLQSAFLGLFATILLAMLPPAVLNYLAGRRKKQFNAMLPDTLQLLSGTLRAGYSMMQGVEAVSQEVSEPMQREFRRVVTESRLGRPLEESLDAVGDRMGSPDFKWAVMAIRIQREVGGNLSELLLTVAETMTARERLRRDVAALTAEGKISAIVLGILPVGLFGAMYVINREYVSVLWTEPIGKAMAIGAFLLAVAGYAWMLKLIKIEI